MNASKQRSPRSLKFDLKRIDSHKIEASEHKELPELSDAMLERGTLKRAGRPVAANPHRQVNIRLPETVLAAWKATGLGWQIRAAELLSKRAS